MTNDQTIHEALERVTTSLQQELDNRLKAATAELLGAARAEADRRVAEETARARAEVEQQFAAESARLNGDLDSLRRERDELQSTLASAREASEHADLVARQTADETLAAAREQADRAVADLEDVRSRLAAAEQVLEELRTSEAGARADSARTLAELNDLRSRTAGEQPPLENIEASRPEATRVEERQDKLAALDRLVASLRRLDAVAALSEVLNVLAESLAAEAPRSAVLVPAPDGFRVYRMTGFEGAAPQPIALVEASGLSGGLPFDPLPADHVGFSVPIEVGSQTVAIVYADDCSGQEEPVPASWPEAVEVLARHAALRLGMLTALKTVHAVKSGQYPAAGAVSTVGRAVSASAASTTGDDQSARRYARLLVSEIKLYNEATVRLGRINRDLFERLRPEIERAKTLYEQRVPAHVPARSTYFDDELVQTLADGDPALLGSRG